MTIKIGDLFMDSDGDIIKVLDVSESGVTFTWLYVYGVWRSNGTGVQVRGISLLEKEFSPITQEVVDVMKACEPQPIIFASQNRYIDGWVDPSKIF